MKKKRPVTEDLTKQETEEIIRSKDVRAKMKRRTVSKWVAIALIIALVMTGGAWGVLSFIEQNSTKIVVNKGQDGLALGIDPDVSKPTSKLLMKGPKSLGDITYTDVDFDNSLATDGENNGLHYLGYSFYLKNMSALQACYYNLSLKITQVSRGADAAFRVALISDSDDADKRKMTIYAKPRADGSPEYLCYDSDEEETQQPIPEEALRLHVGDILESNATVPFEGEGDDGAYYIMRQSDNRLVSLQVRRYTVIVWLEGSDAQCKDDINLGTCRIEIVFDLDRYDDAVLPDDFV